MVKFYVDSNVFFYAKINDRAFGQSCSGIIRKIAAGRVEAAASALVPMEVANALRKYGLQDEALDEVHAICSLGIDVYTIEAADVREAAEICREVRISPYDCLHVAMMQKYSLREIISADKDFDKVEWLNRSDPRSIFGVKG